AAALGVRRKELQAREAVQEDLVARRIAQRTVDAQDGDLEDLARLDVVRNRYLLLALRDGLVSEGDAVDLVETTDGAAAALAEGQVDFAVDPPPAVVVHDGLEPHRPAAERLAIDGGGNGDLRAIPAEAILAGAATLLQRLRL